MIHAYAEEYLDDAMRNHLRDARYALNEYAELIPDYLTGQYVHWYDGCQKVAFRTVVEKLDKLLIQNHE